MNPVVVNEWAFTGAKAGETWYRLTGRGLVVRLSNIRYSYLDAWEGTRDWMKPVYETEYFPKAFIGRENYKELSKPQNGSDGDFYYKFIGQPN